MTSPAERLKSARRLAGLTQLQAARRVGVSERTYQYWESGKHAPPGYALDAVLRRLTP